MMDVSQIAIISAGAGAIIIGGCAYLVWLSLPRDEDYFESDLAELLELTTAPGYSTQRPWRAACGNTVSHHQPGRGRIVECEASPPIISGSGRTLPGDPESGGRAVQPRGPQGAPVPSVSSCRGFSSHGTAGTGGLQSESVLFIQPDEGGGDAPVVRSHRSRPVMFLVSSK